MTQAFIGVGSNIRPQENVSKALGLLARKVPIVAISTFYRTEPLLASEGSWFINGVVQVETKISPLDLKFGVLRVIERELGRIRTVDKCAPRPIDLDLLLYGDQSIHADDLVVPDPEIAERAFLAVALAELAPELVPPGSDRSMLDLALSVKLCQMTSLQEFSHSLTRKLICR